MASRGRLIALRLTALAACIGMSLGLAACASGTPAEGTATDQQTQTGEQTAGTGGVAIFTPSDGVTISQHTPLNKWTKFVPSLVSALREQHVAKSDIDTFTADSLDKQSRDIQDYVVDHVSSSNAQSDSSSKASADTKDSSKITLVVAPVASPDDTVRQYGDYVSQTIKGTDGETVASEKEQTEREAADRLVSSLTLAQESGMHVVLLSSTPDGFQPDAYVRMSTAEQIGKIQAEKLVGKLALASASTDNPKAIEVMLPYDAAAADGTGSGASGDAADGTASEDSAAFAKEAFKGIWSVLQPYFKAGKAVCPSASLTASTTEDDWQDVAFASGKTDSVRNELKGRLGMKSGSDQHTRIDGIIALNDYTALDVVKTLDELTYTGSAADINPSITISGIVGNITGKKDLQRKAVPDPIKSPEAADDGAGQSDGSTDADGDGAGKDAEEINARWPIVTGYGAYVDAMPQIVAGQQWMTALEDRDTLAADTATVCVLLNQGKPLTSQAYVKATKINGKGVPTVIEDLLAVSASNLKTTLIDPGYITLAEAGL